MSGAQGQSVRFSRRLWVAIALLPLVDTVFAYLVLVVWWSVDAGIRPDRRSPVAWAIFTGLVALVMTIAGALPALSSLTTRGHVSFTRLVGTGAVLGNAPFAFLIVGIALPITVSRYFDGSLSGQVAVDAELIASVVQFVGFGSLIGAWSGVFVWLVGFSPIEQE